MTFLHNSLISNFQKIHKGPSFFKKNFFFNSAQISCVEFFLPYTSGPREVITQQNSPSKPIAFSNTSIHRGSEMETSFSKNLCGLLRNLGWKIGFLGLLKKATICHKMISNSSNILKISLNIIYRPQLSTLGSNLRLVT